MFEMKQYVISVIAAAIICSCVGVLVQGKSAGSRAVKLISGIYLVLTIASPFCKIKLDDWKSFTEKVALEADDLIEYAIADRENAYRESIKEQTEAYILDKAAVLAPGLSVEVTLSEKDPPVPCAVMIAGQIQSPAKEALQYIIENELNIPKEAQSWNG